MKTNPKTLAVKLLLIHDERGWSTTGSYRVKGGKVQFGTARPSRTRRLALEHTVETLIWSLERDDKS